MNFSFSGEPNDRKTGKKKEKMSSPTSVSENLFSDFCKIFAFVTSLLCGLTKKFMENIVLLIQLKRLHLNEINKIVVLNEPQSKW